MRPYLLLFIMLLVPGMCFGRQFTAAGSMSTPRAYCTATLLKNGKVLVAGGVNDNGNVTTAEIFDPDTGEWRLTGTMVSSHSLPTATLLTDGTVLVAGGGMGPENAEIFDPSTEKWTATGKMATEVVYHSATLLPNGHVLVAGGLSLFPYGSTTKVQDYDPVTRKWAIVGNLKAGRQSFAINLLPDGNILVSGGINIKSDDDPNLSNAELYDFDSETSAFTSSLSETRFDFSAFALPDGRIIAVGGRIWVYTPPVGLPEDTIYAYRSSCELFDPSSKSWNFVGSLDTARSGYQAVQLEDGNVAVFGGYNADGYLSSIEIYDVDSQTWKLGGKMDSPNALGTATLLPDGKVLLAGGYTGHTYLNTAAFYDPFAPLDPDIVFPPTQTLVTPPVVKIIGHSRVGTKRKFLTLKGNAIGEVTKIVLTVSKVPVPVVGIGNWHAKIKLKLGNNQVRAYASGPNGNSTIAAILVIRKAERH